MFSNYLVDDRKNFQKCWICAQWKQTVAPLGIIFSSLWASFNDFLCESFVVDNDRTVAVDIIKRIFAEIYIEVKKKKI